MEIRDERRVIAMKYGIYVHIPFCIKKCPYCDFTSFTPKKVPEKEYVKALVREIEFRVEEAGISRVETVYFGGGTPSLISPKGISSILSVIAEEFALLEPEITLEANPGTVDLERLKGYRDTGINRLSLGVQSFNDRLLSNLGRIHTRVEALNAFESAKKAGFDNVGIDLIHSIPGESLKDWNDDLKNAVSLRPEHISAYNLTIEEGTPFYCKQEKGLLMLSHEEEQVDMLMSTEDVLCAAGYEHYEVSNYALPGFRSRHNQLYWKCGNYLGFGVSAHSYISSSESSVQCSELNNSKLETPNSKLKKGWGIRRANTSDLEEYFNLINEKGSAVIEEEVLTKEKAMGEAIFLGLRMMEGINLKDFEDRFGKGIEESFPNAVRELTKEDFLISEKRHLRLTKKGLLFLNDVSLRFV